MGIRNRRSVDFQTRLSEYDREAARKRGEHVAPYVLTLRKSTGALTTVRIISAAVPATDEEKLPQTFGILVELGKPAPLQMEVPEKPLVDQMEWTACKSAGLLPFVILSFCFSYPQVLRFSVFRRSKMSLRQSLRSLGLFSFLVWVSGHESRSIPLPETTLPPTRLVLRLHEEPKTVGFHAMDSSAVGPDR